MSPVLVLIAIAVALGIGSGAFLLGVFVLIDLVYEPRSPSTHIAGPDDEDIDFDAALRPIGRPPR